MVRKVIGRIFLLIVTMGLVVTLAQVLHAQDKPPDAMVTPMNSRLRLHDAPSLGSPTQTFLDGAAPLNIIGRTADEEWLQVRTLDDVQGWVTAQYLTLFVSLDNVPITTDLAALDRGYALPDDVADQVRQIFEQGQSLGNRSDVFSKVGDSISVSSNWLHPIGQGIYNLGDFQFLQGAIDYFSRTAARDGQNSFDVNSVATGVGWSTDAILSPYYADPAQCASGEIAHSPVSIV